MLSSFVPISLLVLAGFGLGLLVGRLAWGSRPRNAVADQAPAAPVTKASGGLPAWEMEEIHPLERNASPSVADAGDND